MDIYIYVFIHTYIHINNKIEQNLIIMFIWY